MNSRCQSCGMPLTKDPAGGGTNAGGSKSTVYCSLCYEDGSFKGLCANGKEMQQFVREKMREEGWNPILVWLLTLDIPRLSRWKMKR